MEPWLLITVSLLLTIIISVTIVEYFKDNDE